MNNYTELIVEILMKIVWLIRASISYQLRYKKETDTILLSIVHKKNYG